MNNKYKRIEYEDDIVLVLDENGDEIYKGLEDYEPYKDEAWKWDEKTKSYKFRDLTKKCLAL